jgi:hypothetical protein
VPTPIPLCRAARTLQDALGFAAHVPEYPESVQRESVH